MSNATTTRHSADVGERAVRMFIERRDKWLSEGQRWPSMATKFGVTPELAVEPSPPAHAAY
jgi:hypothetical protein